MAVLEDKLYPVAEIWQISFNFPPITADAPGWVTVCK